MKSKRLYYAYLIGILFIFPIINSTNAVAQKPDYVGFNENDEFIWDISYDEEVDAEMGDDLGINTTVFDLDDDIRAVKAIITWISDEGTCSGEECVKYKINRYDMKKGDDWKLEKEGKEYGILDFDRTDDDVLDFYKGCVVGGGLIAASNVDWKRVMASLEDDFDDTASWADYDDLTREMYIKFKEYTYLNLSSYTTETITVETVVIYARYTNNGILSSYTLDYGEERVITISLRYAFWIDYWLWIIIGIVALGAIITLILYFAVIKQKPTPKKEVPSAVPLPDVGEDQAKETEKIEEAPTEKGIFCPYCGSANPAASKFCEYCGKNIEEETPYN